LSGNSITSIICTVSFDPRHEQETISTLKFAVDCKKIKMNAKINQDSSEDSTLLAQYQREIIELKDLLQKQKQLTMEAKSLQTETFRPIIVLTNEKKEQKEKKTNEHEIMKSSEENQIEEVVVSPSSNNNIEHLNSLVEIEVRQLNAEIEKEKGRSQELQRNIERLKGLFIRGDLYHNKGNFGNDTQLFSSLTPNENGNHVKRRVSCLPKPTPLENLMKKDVSSSSTIIQNDKSVSDEHAFSETKLLKIPGGAPSRVETGVNERRKSRLLLTNDVELTIKNVIETEMPSPIHSPKSISDNENKDYFIGTEEGVNRAAIEDEWIILRARERLLERDRKDINAQKYLLKRRKEEQELELEMYRKSLEAWETNLFDFMKKYNIQVKKVLKAEKELHEVSHTRTNSNGQLLEHATNDLDLKAWTYEFESSQLDGNEVDDGSFSHRRVQFIEEKDITRVEDTTHHLPVNTLSTPESLSGEIQANIIELSDKIQEEKDNYLTNEENYSSQKFPDKDLELSEDDIVSNNPLDKKFIADLFSSLPNFNEILTKNIASPPAEKDHFFAELNKKGSKSNVVSSKRQDRLNQKQFMETFRKVKLPVSSDHDITSKEDWDDIYNEHQNRLYKLRQKMEEQQAEEVQLSEKTSKSTKDSKNQRKRHDLKTVKERLQQTKRLSLFTLNTGKVQKDEQVLNDQESPSKEYKKKHMLAPHLANKVNEENSKRKEKKKSSNPPTDSNWASSLLYRGPLDSETNTKTYLKKQKKKQGDKKKEGIHMR